MFERVKTFFAEHTEIDPNDIHMDSELTLLGVTSLQLLMIITDFEEEFSVEIPDRALEHIHTIGDIVALVE